MRGASRAARIAAVLAGAFALHACASNPPPAPVAASPPLPPPSAYPPPPGRVASVADLPGWAEEDHAGALAALQRGCIAAKAPAMQQFCSRARALGPVGEPAARMFLEANLAPLAVGRGGLLTAYFAPDYEGRLNREGPFTAPVRARPVDLITLNLGLFDSALSGKTLAGRIAGDAFAPYDDRAVIEARPAGDAIAWMKPEDLFFLQIQGSGRIALPGGRHIKLSFAGSNGRPFVGVASVLRDQGALADGDASGEAIRGWLAGHRGPEADAVMRRNPRYVFFKAGPDDGLEPPGSAGVPLTPGRSIAVDPSLHPMGGVYWIDGEAPMLAGAPSRYRRLVIALDSGGAIKGAVRADLYLGSGQGAGFEAGRVRHALDLYELVPVGAAP